MKNEQLKKVFVFILPLIIGLLIGSVIYFFMDVYWLKLVVSITIIILSVVVAIKNIVNPHRK